MKRLVLCFRMAFEAIIGILLAVNIFRSVVSGVGWMSNLVNLVVAAIAALLLWDAKRVSSRLKQPAPELEYTATAGVPGYG